MYFLGKVTFLRMSCTMKVKSPLYNTLFYILFLQFTVLFLPLSPQVLCKKVSSIHLWSMVTYLLDGLIDYQGHSSSGACVVLNQIVKQRGSTLSEQVQK